MSEAFWSGIGGLMNKIENDDEGQRSTRSNKGRLSARQDGACPAFDG
jgi:hypothetical protein